MTAIITSIFAFLGSAANGLFGFKGSQVKAVETAIETLKTVDNNDAATIAAQANAISVILTQGSWLEKQWRPILMLLLMTIIGCWFFGLVPPNFDGQISPMMREVLDLLKIGVMGYVPCRTLEKVITSINIASILKQMIGKKVL